MKKIILYTLFITLISLFSCDNLTDLNDNPNSPQDVQSTTLIPPIQQQMALSIQNDTRFIGRYVQYFSSNATGNRWDQYGYDPNSDAGGEIWRMAYWSIGLNLTKMQEIAQKENRYDIVGFSKVIRGWSWQVATDYHEYLLKFDQIFTPRLTFDYDNQQTAYNEVIRLVQEGIKDLEKTDGAVSESYFQRGDFIYQGKREQWIKFANGILARNANNISNKKGIYNPDLVIKYCDNSLKSSADDAFVNFNGSISDDSSYFGKTRNTYSTFRQTDYIVNSMNGTIYTGVIDPRISRILVPSKGESESAPNSSSNPDISKYVFNGNPLNTTEAAGNIKTQIPNFYGDLKDLPNPGGRYIFRDKAPFPLMTYTEIQFIKAEAAFHKGDKALALSSYINGISASFDLVNKLTNPSSSFPVTSLITSQEKNDFLANTTVVPTNPNNLTLSMIMHQKYIALYIFGTMETWVDMRKYQYSTDIYPMLNTLPNGGLYSSNAERLPYRVRPRYNSEYVWNFQAIESISGDNLAFHTDAPINGPKINRLIWFAQK